MNRGVQVAGYALAVLLVLVLQVRLWDWNVEDAAISMGYAKHIAEGWGPVPYYGGERVEGYSNPTWVALQVPFFWLGADPFDVVPALGLAFTLASLWVGARLGRHLWGPMGGVVLALVLACHAQVAIWAQSGLENGLFVFLLLGGLWRLRVDGDDATAPVWFLLLALTRPEAPVLAVIGGGVSVVSAVSRGGDGLRDRVRRWLVGFLVPFAAYHVLRFVTFGVEFPATYYAKIREELPVWSWEGRNWRYFRDAHALLGLGALLPFLVFAATGQRGWRGGVGAAALAVGLAAMVAPIPGDQRVPLILGSWALAVALAWTRSPWWGGVVTMGAVEALFAWRTPDWMLGFRWFSLTAVPVVLLVGALILDGAGRLRTLSTRAAGCWIVGWLVAWGVPQARFAWDYADRPETSPGSILKRVRHYEALADTLLLERRPLVMDQDMGANLLWGAERFDVRDVRGLTDLPFALYTTFPQAVDSIVEGSPFGLPEFVHMHGATRRSFQGRPWFREHYVEVPGYPSNATSFHTEQHVRRDLIMGEWDGPRRPFHVDGLEVVGWNTRAPEVSPGAGLFFEIAVRLTERAPDDLQLLLIATGRHGVVQTWALELGYGLLPPKKWWVGETFVGRYPLKVPEDLPLGRYELSLLVLDGNGVRDNLGDRASAPRVSEEEVVLGPGMVLVHPEVMQREAQQDMDAALAKARERSCSTAERRWMDARAHRIRSADWLAARQEQMHLALARCWGDRGSRRADKLRTGRPEVDEPWATADEMLLGAAEEVVRGRSWSPGEERVIRGQIRVGALAAARAGTFDDQGDLESALFWHDVAARLDPRRVWSRRRAEQLRAEVLGIPNRLDSWGGRLPRRGRPAQ